MSKRLDKVKNSHAPEKKSCTFNGRKKITQTEPPPPPSPPSSIIFLMVRPLFRVSFPSFAAQRTAPMWTGSSEESLIAIRFWKRLAMHRPYATKTAVDLENTSNFNLIGEKGSKSLKSPFCASSRDSLTYFCLANRFHFAVRLFSMRSQIRGTQRAKSPKSCWKTFLSNLWCLKSVF